MSGSTCSEGRKTEEGCREDEIRRTASGREGIIRISTQCYTNYHWLPARLKEFQNSSPHVDVEVVVEATPEPIKALLDGKLDLAIVSSPARDRRILYRPPFAAHYVVAMQPGHRLAARSFIRPEDFADETLIAYSNLETNTAFQTVLRPAGVMPRRVQRVQLTEATIEMVKAGLGVCVIAQWAVAPQIVSGEVVVRPLTRHGLYCTWYAALVRSRSRPPYLDNFVKLLAKEPDAFGSGRCSQTSPDAHGRGPENLWLGITTGGFERVTNFLEDLTIVPA